MEHDRHARPVPQRLDLRRQGLRRHERRVSRGAGRADRRARLGIAAGRLARAGGTDDRADHRRRHVGHGLALQPVESAAGRLLHHRARSPDRRGALAGEHGGDSRSAGRRHLGQPRALGPAPHLRLAAGQLRPGTGARLLGHWAAVAAPGTAPRIGQGGPALYQLDACSRSADRRAGLVLPAPAARQLGPGPRLRASDRGDRGVT